MSIVLESILNSRLLLRKGGTLSTAAYKAYEVQAKEKGLGTKTQEEWYQGVSAVIAKEDYFRTDSE